MFKMSFRDDFAKCETDIRIDGKVALVTGATAGTGLEVAKNLAKRGARVIIASRNPAKLANAKKEIIEASGNDNIITGEMDLSSLKSVRNFASHTLSHEPRLDILINNAGAIGLPDKLTEDGLHLMMQVNFFGPFLLTYLLYPLLKKSAPSRIVNVSSFASLLGYIDIEHMNDVGRYNNFGFYANAKLADILFTVEMDRRIQGSGVNVYSMDPGLGKSDIFRNFDDGPVKDFLTSGLLYFGRPLDRVATMPVYLAVDPKFDKLSGRHFRDCVEFYNSWFAGETYLTYRLWNESKKLVEISKEEDWESENVIQ